MSHLQNKELLKFASLVGKVDLQLHVGTKLDGHIFVLLPTLCNELKAAKASQLRSSHTGGKCLTYMHQTEKREIKAFKC